MQSNLVQAATPTAAPRSDVRPEPWGAGIPILVLVGLELAWFASLALRFAEPGPQRSAALAWLLLTIGWLGLQILISRRHLPERWARAFSTLIQAVGWTSFSLALARLWPALGDAALAAAAGAGVAELIAIHTLRLAAWGTVAKWRAGELPGYFFRLGSLPDFGFAMLAVLLTLLIVTGAWTPGPSALLLWSAVGAAAFLGAAVTMYFGVPGTLLSWRWPRVERGLEPPTLLPFRWPMNLAPAVTVPLFMLAHALAVAKVLAV